MTAQARPVRPFLLPPPSTSRFTLAQLALGASALFASSWFLIIRPASSPTGDDACVDAAARPPPPASPGSVVEAYVACTSDGRATQALLVLGGPVLLAVVATLGWLAAPHVLARRWRVVPVEAGPRRKVLDRLALETGLGRTPAWYLTGGRKDRDHAWTFGRWPHHGVVVGTNLLTGLCHSEEPGQFRASIAHELAHLRNRDVDRTYWTLCAFLAFGGVATLLMLDAFAVSRVGADLGWRVAAVALVVLASTAGALRAREHDADLRVAASDRGEMRDAIERTLQNRAVRSGRPAWARWHPSDRRRRDVVDDPRLVLALAPGECLAAGLASGIVLVELPAVVADLLGDGVDDVVAAYLLGAWLTCLPLAGVVGLASWRGAVAAADTGARPPRAVLPGVVLAAGVLAGSQIAPRSSAVWVTVSARAPDRAFSPTLRTVALPTAVWLTTSLLLIAVLFVMWSIALGSAFGAAADGRTTGRPARYVLLSATVLGVPLGIWFCTLRLAADGIGLASLAAALVDRHAPEALLAVTILAAVVLVRRTPRARSSAGLVAVAATLVLVFLVAGGAPTPTAAPVRTGPSGSLVVPAFRQVGNACLWFEHVRPLDGVDAGYQRRFGTSLHGIDDGVTRAIGVDLVATADDPGGAAASLDRTAFVRRCDALRTDG